VGTPVTTGVSGTMDVYLGIDAEVESPLAESCYTEPHVVRLPLSAFHSYLPSPEAKEVSISLLPALCLSLRTCVNPKKKEGSGQPLDCKPSPGL
jgi:hypothetical protein